MTLRYVNILAALLLTGMSFGQGMEFGAFAEGGLMITNRIKDQSLPLLIDYDENLDDLNYFATDREVSDSYGYGAFMQANIPSLKVTFGMRVSMSSALIRYKGYNDYTQEFYEDTYGDFNSYNVAQGGNATQGEYADYIDSKRTQHQNSFNILTRRNDYAMGLFVGKRFNTYKSWRPYIFGTLSQLIGGTDVLKADLGETNRITTPTFNTDFMIRQRLSLGATGGIEWRNWKFYGNITVPLRNERLNFDTDDDGNRTTSLPYSYWARFNIGLATRINGSTNKPSSYYQNGVGQITNPDRTVFSDLQHRQAKFWEFGIGATLMPLTFVGVDFDKGAAFLSMKTTQDTIIPTIIGADPIIRDRVKMEQAEFLFTPDAKGLYAFGVFNAFRFRKFRLQTDLFYRPLNIHAQSDESRLTMVEYTPGNFSPEAGSRDFSNSTEFLLKYHEMSIRSRLSLPIYMYKQKFCDVYVGYDLNFLKLRDQFYRDGNTNTLEMYEGLHQILMGNETPENMADLYVNFDRDQIPQLEESFYDPAVAYTPISESEFIQKNTLLKNSAVTLGMQWTLRRLTANLGGGAYLGSWQGRTFFEKGGFMQLSLYLMVFGY